MAGTVPYPGLALIIGGRAVRDRAASSPVLDPGTGEVIGRVPHATVADLDAALAAAAVGFRAWRAVPAHERARILRRAADLVRGRLDAVADVLTLEQGKTLAEARTKVGAAADILEWSGEEGRRTYGRIVPGRVAGVRQMVLKEPVGPVAAFAPWNFPAVTPARKLGGALGAGCSIILKPAEETPATALALVGALLEAGVPGDAVSVVFGDPAMISAHLIASPVIRKVSFTGSTPVGKHLARLAADGMKRATMELGGHAPVLVFDDADVDAAADASAVAKFRNAGQVCVSPTRFYVQEGIYDRFVDRFAQVARTLQVGHGLDAASRMGPVANARRLDAMQGFVADAAAHGAEVVAGGARIGNSGFFWQPTVLAGVPEDARIMLEEPFGPLAPIARFRTFEDAVARANALPFGLAAYAFTRDTRRATAVSDAAGGRNGGREPLWRVHGRNALRRRERQWLRLRRRHRTHRGASCDQAGQPALRVGRCRSDLRRPGRGMERPRRNMPPASHQTLV